MSDEHSSRRDRVANVLGMNRSNSDVTAVLGAVRDVHPMKCPACETTLRATNCEWLYDRPVRGEGTGDVVASQFVSFSSYSHTDEKEQLYYCPNADCRVERVTRGDA